VSVSRIPLFRSFDCRSAGWKLAVRIFQSVSHLCLREHDFGRGFIALAALIFGKWRPVQTLPPVVVWFTEAVSIQMQGAIKLPAFFATLLRQTRVMIFPSSLLDGPYL